VMKVLAINGSVTPPRQSTSRLLLDAFLDGARAAGADIEDVNLAAKKILPCDCGHRFACWVETPGRCIHADGDDVADILAVFQSVDAVVFATPLYVESMTGLLKTFLDRTLPLKQPYIELYRGECRHPLRAMKEGKKFALIAACGMYELSHLDNLAALFERLALNMHGDLVGRLLRPHAMLLRDPQRAGAKYETVLAACRVAGSELVRQGRVSPGTEQAVAMPLCDRAAFIEGANRVWERAIAAREFT